MTYPWSHSLSNQQPVICWRRVFALLGFFLDYGKSTKCRGLMENPKNQGKSSREAVSDTSNRLKLVIKLYNGSAECFEREYTGNYDSIGRITVGLDDE